jgi:iron complex transport system substrate-binding protein
MLLRLLISTLLCLQPIMLWAQKITVIDSLDRKVTLDGPARRIVTLAPHLAENVFSAGAGTHLVGVASYSDYPDQALDLPRIGDFNAFSLERIAELQPDLVLLWASGNGIAAIERLAPLGVPVYADEIRTVDQIPQSIRAIGRMAGTEAASEASAKDFERDITALRDTHQREEKPSVFYQIWHQPLQTVGGDHLISQLITLCGGQNLFGDTSSLAPRVSLEAVLSRDPDLIIGSGMDGSRPPWLDDWQRFPAMKAVRDNQLHYVHPDTIQRPTLRILDGARALCGVLDQAINTNPTR